MRGKISGSDAGAVGSGDPCLPKAPRWTRAIMLVALAGIALSGCGRSISGTYLPANGGMSPYQKLEFESGDTVDLATMFGMTMRGTYKIDGKKVIVTIANASVVFSIDDAGCLDGGMEGKYCQK